MNTKGNSKPLGKSGKVRINLFGGLDGVFVGNREISKEGCREILRGAYGKEPSNLSSYLALGRTVSQAFTVEPKKYSHRNYV